jgi:hypothetical protein
LSFCVLSQNDNDTRQTTTTHEPNQTKPNQTKPNQTKPNHTQPHPQSTIPNPQSTIHHYTEFVSVSVSRIEEKRKETGLEKKKEKEVRNKDEQRRHEK